MDRKCVGRRKYIRTDLWKPQGVCSGTHLVLGIDTNSWWDTRCSRIYSDVKGNARLSINVVDLVSLAGVVCLTGQNGKSYSLPAMFGTDTTIKKLAATKMRLVRCAASLGFACATLNGIAQNATSAVPQGWSPDAAALKLHMIGNAHVDAPWLWPLSEATAVVHSTFRSALDRMKEDPGLTMTTSSSQFY